MLTSHQLSNISYFTRLFPRQPSLKNLMMPGSSSQVLLWPRAGIEGRELKNTAGDSQYECAGNQKSSDVFSSIAV
jgi:hypothetical protein